MQKNKNRIQEKKSKKADIIGFFVPFFKHEVRSNIYILNIFIYILNIFIYILKYISFISQIY